MHFTTSTAIAALAFTTATLAAPVRDLPVFARGPSSAYDNATTTASVPIATLTAQFTRLYNGNTNQIFQQDSLTGIIDTYPGNHGAWISSIVGFFVPSTYAADKYMCELVFDLTSGLAPKAPIAGTARADVFTTRAPATTDVSTFPPTGNNRDTALGRLVVSPGARALVDPSVAGNGFRQPCKNIAGAYFAAEIVPVGDEDHVDWAAGIDGPKIVVYSS